jgi:acetyl esterase/lipase
VRELSNELQVTSNTPPCFLWSTADDATVPVENSLNFAAALRRARVPLALHVYEHGPHGMGLGSKSDPSKRLPWTFTCADWLRARGF